MKLCMLLPVLLVFAATTAQGAEAGPKASERGIALLRFQPKQGTLGDAIPFYWQGQYHVFYLCERRWEHIVTSDLVHWTELPAALEPGSDPHGPDGEACWTGSIVEHDGAFWLFYTGKNAQDPAGDQKVMMARSQDLVRWEKLPERTFYADGKHYWSKPVNGAVEPLIYHHQAFRDPDVFWHEGQQQWWMLLHALAVDGLKPCVGLYTSRDLLQWTAHDPLAVYSTALSLDCPHAAPLPGRWFLLAADTNYTSAERPDGPYPPGMLPYDSGDLFVPKSAWDGRRRLIWGWVRPLEGEQDTGKGLWGGTLSMAREIYAGPEGQLYSRPPREVSEAFTQTALSLATKPALDRAQGEWRYDPSGLVCGEPGGTCSLPVPDDYWLQAVVQLDPEATLTVVMRQQDAADDGYRLVLCPKAHRGEIHRAGGDFGREIDLPVDHPITVQALVHGSILECFIDERFAFTCRAYDHRQGRLGLKLEGGGGRVQELMIKTLAAPEP